MALKTCEFCLKEYTPGPLSRGQRFCNPECASEGRKRDCKARTRKRRLPVAPLQQYASDRGILLEVTNEVLTFWDADTFAIKHLGVHPSLIWGDAWWQAAAA